MPGASIWQAGRHRSNQSSRSRKLLTLAELEAERNSLAPNNLQVDSAIGFAYDCPTEIAMPIITFQESNRFRKPMSPLVCERIDNCYSLQGIQPDKDGCERYQLIRSATPDSPLGISVYASLPRDLKAHIYIRPKLPFETSFHNKVQAAKFLISVLATYCPRA